MDARKIILLVGALIIAAVTAFVARSLVLGQAAPTAQAVPAVIAPPAPTGPEVMVATRALPVGTILDQTSVTFKPWPSELIDKAYFVKDRPESNIKNLLGTVVRVAITAGQPVTQGALVKPGDRGFLAAALGPGMRAVTVPLQGQQQQVAGFIFPGDRIDLILNQRVAGGGDGPPLNVTETVMRNLRVLATDSHTDQAQDDKGNTVVRPYNSVTVEATPKLAEKIVAIQNLGGSLSVALRSIADNASELEEKIASGAINVPDGLDAKAEQAMMKRAEGEPVAAKNSYVTGADVSRFQRATVPGKTASADAPTGAPGAAPAGGYPGAPRGPVVRIARGNNVTEVPVGGKN
ncbi:MAG: Flp pilus assembly protein CpaB [Proteobacteria bacterium SG_bin5]|nr:Flp pilus assembly protein CpaB [Sphingomonas sp.]OQW42886.1 MAG: Flp pilus assembly protein CpaB [Proteobacteria bacterium SG_bin5]